MRLIATGVLLGFWLTASAAAQAKPAYSSCGWWQELRADPKNELYLVGYRQGLIAGVAAYPLPDSPADDKERTLLDAFLKGQIQLLQRSALLDDYINEKCADPKNVNVRLYGLLMLGTYERGGIPASRIESALKLFREEAAPKRYAVIDVLSAK